MITYADNTAMKYFLKQGFNYPCKLPARRYIGWIKEYQYATLMDCYIKKYVDYVRIDEIIKGQLKELIRVIKSRVINGVGYDGMVVERLAR